MRYSDLFEDLNIDLIKGLLSNQEYHYTSKHFGTAKAAKARWMHQNKLGDLTSPNKYLLNHIASVHNHKYWDETQHQVIPVFLRIENPLRVIDHGLNHTSLRFAEQLSNKFKIAMDEMFADPSKPTDQEIIKTVLERGYDGFAYKNKTEHVGSISWIITNPSQVRSVFDFF